MASWCGQQPVAQHAAKFAIPLRRIKEHTFECRALTGLPVALNPFYTNTAVAGLEFVY